MRMWCDPCGLAALAGYVSALIASSLASQPCKPNSLETEGCDHHHCLVIQAPTSSVNRPFRLFERIAPMITPWSADEPSGSSSQGSQNICEARRQAQAKVRVAEARTAATEETAQLRATSQDREASEAESLRSLRLPRVERRMESMPPPPPARRIESFPSLSQQPFRCGGCRYTRIPELRFDSLDHTEFRIRYIQPRY
jgi:hypothetical protein